MTVLKRWQLGASRTTNNPRFGHFRSPSACWAQTNSCPWRQSDVCDLLTRGSSYYWPLLFALGCILPSRCFRTPLLWLDFLHVFCSALSPQALPASFSPNWWCREWSDVVLLWTSPKPGTLLPTLTKAMAMYQDVAKWTLYVYLADTQDNLLIYSTPPTVRCAKAIPDAQLRGCCSSRLFKCG